MQQYMFAALWSRPVGRSKKFGSWGASFGTYLDGVIREVVAKPWPWCWLFSMSGLLFELILPPLAVWYGGIWAMLFGFTALFFHFGVFLFQGINFLSYWNPAMLVFLIDTTPVNSSACFGLETLMHEPLDAADIPLVLALLYLVAQFFVAFTFVEAYAAGFLPLSCMPVFCVSTNIFQPTVPMAVFSTQRGGPA